MPYERPVLLRGEEKLARYRLELAIERKSTLNQVPSAYTAIGEN
jgi:hypothetical protein